MPGFFGLFDFTKEGKGVDKDAPQKARFVIFFEIFFRKFWNLLKLNLLFLLFNLPAFVIAFLISYLVIPQGLIPVKNPIVSSDYAVIGEMFIRGILGLLVCLVPVITVGPSQCGFTYVLRNYSKQEHAFVWGDFIEHAKSNFKQSIGVMIIDIVILSVSLTAISFYYTNVFQEGSLFTSFLFGIAIMALVIFIMMHIYLYPMLVTFHVTLKQLYMNCFKFAMFKFIPNLFMLILCAAIIIGPFLIPVYGYIIGSSLLIFITLSFIGLMTNFYAYPLLKKYMIDKQPGGDDYSGDENSEDETQEDNNLLEDNTDSDEEQNND